MSDRSLLTDNFHAMREVHEVGARTREWTVGHAALAVRGITMAGISHAYKGFKFETEGWAFGQILFCFGGEGRVRVRGRWRKCAKGSVYATPAGVPHSYRAVGDEPWKLCWLVYHGPFHETPLAGLEHAALLSTDPRPIRSAIAGFRHESIGRADPVVLRASADVIYLLSMRATQGGHIGDRLWRIWDEVGADLGRHWTVADLAAVIDVSEEHLRRLCQERLGCAPMEHVGRLRMRKAAVLLKTSDQKIGTIAEQVAYADRFGFSAAFRRYFGTSPAQYRREGETSRDHGSSSRPPRDEKTDAEGHEAKFVQLASIALPNTPRKMKLGNERNLRNLA